MNRSGEDPLHEGCPAGPQPSDGPSPLQAEQTVAETPDATTDSDDDPLTFYEPL